MTVYINDLIIYFLKNAQIKSAVFQNNIHIMTIHVLPTTFRYPVRRLSILVVIMVLLQMYNEKHTFKTCLQYRSSVSEYWRKFNELIKVKVMREPQ